MQNLRRYAGVFVVLAACQTSTMPDPNLVDASDSLAIETSNTSALPRTEPTPDFPATPDNPLMSPEYCKGCHPDHYREWAGSMHAYASDDPLFQATNLQGYLDSNGAQQEACVRCHAPLAIQANATRYGLNLNELPNYLRGVTCYYCHTVEKVDSLDIHGVKLASDNVIRGNLTDAVATEGHESSYSVVHDGAFFKSSDFCATCHDAAHKEWSETFFADADAEGVWPAAYAQTCGECHMPSDPLPTAIASVAGVPERRRHNHAMTGFGVVLTDFPTKKTAETYAKVQADATHQIRRTALCSSICVKEEKAGVQLRVWVHNEGGGHTFPSRSNLQRPAWARIEATLGDDVLLLAGDIPSEQSVLDAKSDKNLWALEEELTVPATMGGDGASWRSRVYELSKVPDSVTLDVHVRPMRFNVLDDLVERGLLAKSIRDKVPTFTILPASIVWAPELAEEIEGMGQCVATSDVCRAPELMADQRSAGGGSVSHSGY